MRRGRRTTCSSPPRSAGSSGRAGRGRLAAALWYAFLILRLLAGPPAAATAAWVPGACPHGAARDGASRRDRSFLGAADAPHLGAAWDSHHRAAGDAVAGSPAGAACYPVVIDRAAAHHDDCSCTRSCRAGRPRERGVGPPSGRGGLSRDEVHAGDVNCFPHGPAADHARSKVLRWCSWHWRGSRRAATEQVPRSNGAITQELGMPFGGTSPPRHGTPASHRPADVCNGPTLPRAAAWSSVNDREGKRGSPLADGRGRPSTGVAHPYGCLHGPRSSALTRPTRHCSTLSPWGGEGEGVRRGEWDLKRGRRKGGQGSRGSGADEGLERNGRLRWERGHGTCH